MLPPDVAADFALLFKFYFSAAHTQHTHTNTHGASDACDTRTRRQSVSQCASDGQRLALLAADPPSADHQRHLWTAAETTCRVQTLKSCTRQSIGLIWHPVDMEEIHLIATLADWPLSTTLRAATYRASAKLRPKIVTKIRVSSTGLEISEIVIVFLVKDGKTFLLTFNSSAASIVKVAASAGRHDGKRCRRF